MTFPESPNEYLPPLSAVTGAYEEVLAHNNRHGVGSTYRNLMTAIVNMMDDGDIVGGLDVVGEPTEVDTAPGANAPVILDEHVAAAVAEGDMEGDVQGILQEDIFTRIGIELSPEGGRFEKADGSARASSVELEPRIVNTELFGDFLGTLSPADTAQMGTCRTLLANVARVLRREAVYYNGDIPEGRTEEEMRAIREHGSETLRTFSRIEDAFRQLGIDTPDTQLLGEYVVYWGRGLLNEYLHVGPIERLSHEKLDCMDGMAPHWSEKIDYIKSLILDERTRGFGLEAAEALRAGLAKTIGMIDQNPEEWYATDEDRKVLAGLLTQLGYDAPPAPGPAPAPTGEQSAVSTGDPVLDALARVLRTLNEQ